MPRTPSYDFERRERQKAKDAKRAAKTAAKRENTGQATHAEPEPKDDGNSSAGDKAIS